MTNTLLTCGLEIFERPNNWKWILIGEETKIRGLNTRPSWTTCSDTILKGRQTNTQLYVETCVPGEKPLYFSSYYFLMKNTIGTRENK